MTHLLSSLSSESESLDGFSLGFLAESLSGEGGSVSVDGLGGVGDAESRSVVRGGLTESGSRGGGLGEGVGESGGSGLYEKRTKSVEALVEREKN